MKGNLMWSLLPVGVPGFVATLFDVKWGVVVTAVAVVANLFGYAEARRSSP